MSMGRTMSQEEVQQLIVQTVLQVADTLSISTDVAQHLLIHSKWNVDLLVQRYAEDDEVLLVMAGLKVRNPQTPSSPVTQCPVCLNLLANDSESAPTLCCTHYCCKVSFLLSYDGIYPRFAGLWHFVRELGEGMRFAKVHYTSEMKEGASGGYVTMCGLMKPVY